MKALFQAFVRSTCQRCPACSGALSPLRHLPVRAGRHDQPCLVTIGAGQTATARLTLTSPASPGDSDQSVVLSTAQGQTTIPVTVRTTVPVGTGGEPSAAS